MRAPTKQDSETWANTPIATVVKQELNKEGQVIFVSHWQRFEKDKKVVEILEGSNTKYHLRREGTSSLRLVGVEEETVTT